MYKIKDRLNQGYTLCHPPHSIIRNLMSKFLTSVCTYNPPTHQPHPQTPTSNPKPQNPKPQTPNPKPQTPNIQRYFTH